MVDAPVYRIRDPVAIPKRDCEGPVVPIVGVERLARVSWPKSVERWDMPLVDADDWRLRLLARQRFLELDGTATADA